MSTMQFVRRCSSCGAILQCEDPHEEGYIPEKYLNKPLSELLFCASCYAESKYNMTPALPSAQEDYLTMVQDAEARDALIVYVVDLFSFECSFIPEITEHLQGLPMIVIANKRDLLPIKADDDYLKEYVAHRFRRCKIQVTSHDVVLTSFTSLTDTTEISRMIEERRAGHDVYVIGASGAGKTLFLNAFLRTYVNNSRRSIQRADYPGTHLQVLEIPLDNSSSIYDTPGTSLDNSMLTKVDADQVSLLVPSKPIKAHNVSLGANEQLFLGGVVRIDLMSKEKVALRVYAAEDVNVYRHHGKKDQSALFQIMKKKGFEPSSGKLASPSDLDVYEIKVEENGYRDLGIEGLGWISFEGDGQVLRVYVPKGVGIYTTRAKIKVER